MRPARAARRRRLARREDEFAGSAVDGRDPGAPLGTGDAVRSARAALAGHAGDVLVLSGDTPLLTPSSCSSSWPSTGGKARPRRCSAPSPPTRAATAASSATRTATSLRVVEASDATPEELAIGEVNTSIYVFRAEALWPALEQLQPKNAQGELYLTDAIEILVAAGEKVAALRRARSVARPTASTRASSSPRAGAVLRDRINERHMLAGVTIIDPQTTWIDRRSSSRPT